ncbi:MAG: transcription termination factor NusA [Hyphomonadaceae bacterium]|jgi:N utilization substance protein A|nr:transcription termination factor NusA [Hyphomonadaceae bacterium]
MSISANRLELLQIARSVAYEKNIDEDIVLGAIEEAIQKAARARYGMDHDIRAKINAKNGELTLTRVQTVVENQDAVENPTQQIPLSVAQRMQADVAVGHEFTDELPLFDFGRVMSLTGKQVIMQRVREAERDKQFDEYKDRVGDIINGIVKRVEYGNVFVDLGRGEGVIRRNEGLPREMLHAGDRVRCYIYDVRREAKGPQIFLSRAHPGFMAKLFAQEVPEVYDGIIEIKSVARDPSSRAKIAVLSNDSSIDPVGACVGMRGSRVQAVVGELGGEKIDIIPWSEDQATFIVNALQPAEVTKVVLDEEEGRVEVVVPDEQLSLAIGRRGQNVRLASQLTGWTIDILTEEEESSRREKEAATLSELFMGALEVDEIMARLLISEGFETIEDLAWIDLGEILNIEGIDEGTAEELQTRAREHLEREANAQNEKRIALGVEDGLLEIPGITLPMAVMLGEGGVKTVEDLAGLVSDDLRGWFETKNGERVREPGILESLDMSAEDADGLIMQARLAMGWIEALPEAEVADDDAEAAETADADG